MKFFVLFITIFILLFSPAQCAEWVYFFTDKETSRLSNDIVIYNALNLSEEQRVEIRTNQKPFKKLLTKKQKPKYSMIKRLERQNKKRSRNPDKYYKTNPQLRPFGDIRSIKHCEDNAIIQK